MLSPGHDPAGFEGDPELVGLAYRATDELGTRPEHLVTIYWSDGSWCWPTPRNEITIDSAVRGRAVAYVHVRHECAELAVFDGQNTPAIQALLDSDHEANSP